MPVQKPSLCGVKVLTWSSHPDGGNGMLDFVNTKLFGGNVGHAAVMVTFPATDEGKALYDFCKEKHIPCTKRKIITKFSSTDESGKLKVSDENAFEEEVYQAYWSWWPPEGEGKFDLREEISVDTWSERQATPFAWDPKWERYIQPEVRKHDGKLGATIMPYGPNEVWHGREISLEEFEKVEVLSKYQDSVAKVRAIQVLKDKLEKAEKKCKQERKVLSLSRLGVTAAVILDRFIPDWRIGFSNAKKISESEMSNLKNKIKQVEDQHSALKGLYIAEGLNAVIHDLEGVSSFEISESFENYLDMIDYGLLDKKTWRDVLRENNNLHENGVPITTLDEIDIGVLLRICKDHLKEVYKNPYVSVTLEKERLDWLNDKLKDIISAFESLSDPKTRAEIQAEDLEDWENRKREEQRPSPEILNNLTNWNIPELNAAIPPNLKWEDFKNSEFTYQQAKKLQEIVNKKLRAVEKEKVIHFKKEHLFEPPVFEKEVSEYLTKGTPPDGVVNIPIKPLVDSSIGNINGLSIEKMLKMMSELSNPEADAFDLYTKNCSKTVDAILEAGVEDPRLKHFFKEKAFGYFGNPQEVYNNAVKFREALLTRKRTGFLSTLTQFNPLEKMGGFLIGVWMDPKAKAPAKAGVLILGMIVGPLSLIVFAFKKILNPLKSFNNTTNLLKYCWSKKPLKPIAVLFLFPVAVILSPLAGLQFVVKKGIAEPLKKLFSHSPKQLKHLEKEIERELIKTLPKEEREKKFAIEKWEYMNSRKLHSTLKKHGIEVTQKDPKKALEEAHKILMRDQDEKNKKIPVFSKDAMKNINAYLSKRDLTEENLEAQIKARKLFEEITKEITKRVEARIKQGLSKKTMVFSKTKTPEQTIELESHKPGPNAHRSPSNDVPK